jgi:import inner membrane translocase subunit TIM21
MRYVQPQVKLLILQLDSHLLPPLSFTHTPHAAAPIRGSPPLPTRNILHPRSGREHLLLTFWVHGRGIGEEERLGFVKHYYQAVLDYGRAAGEWAGLVPPPIKETQVISQKAEVPKEEGGWGGLLGGFSGLRGGSGSKAVSGGSRGVPPGTYKVGEVHGDYVKVSRMPTLTYTQNAAGHYQLLSLVIDVPASQASHPTRAVVFWAPEADTEGLQGRKR